MRFSARTDTESTIRSSRSPQTTTTGRGRKIPECRTCGTPMRGHKRDPMGAIVCPSMLPSPSPTPERRTASSINSRRSSSASAPPESGSPSPLVSSNSVSVDEEEEETRRLRRQSTPHPSIPYKYRPASPIHHNPRMQPSFEVPEEGYYHRRNPNYIEPHLRLQPQVQEKVQGKAQARAPYVNTNRSGSEAPSEVPTVLCDDDGRTIYSEASSGSLIPRTSHSTSSTSSSRYTPALTLYRAHRTEISHIQNTAHAQGVHTAVLPTTTSSREGSFWLLMGQEPEFVKCVLDSLQGMHMPGDIGETDGKGKREGVTTSFLQLVLAGLVGGFVVFFGVGYLGLRH